MYNHHEIEKKWQKIWEEQGVFAARDNDSRPKFYGLIEFPYPSGDGLHVGHLRSNTAMDIIARKRRMQGYNVLYPIGFDSFGLPTENYAIKTGRPPAEITKENIANFTRQLKMMGFSFDWDRQVTTSDPAYYKWTQWIFLQLFKHGLAYKKKMAINWCPSCKIGLANEEVVDGSCERCGTPVEKREKEQWMLAITKYADKLLEGLKEVDYIDRAKVQQENWIGRKEGINIEYQVAESDKKVVCFTTRPDTNFGATFVVLGPEYPLALELSSVEHKKEVQEYIASTKKTGEAERLAEGREKTGVFTGAYCINNLNNEKMPIWISDYVLGHVGTGAVVGVPGHDVRDFEFAKKFGIPIKRVVVGSDKDTLPITKKEQVQEEKGTMINSGFLDGMDIHAATKKVMDYLEEKGYGKRVVNYKLRDWVFSRQRYWGEPIPLVWCDKCNEWVPLPDDQLPLQLPKVEKYQPTDTGESPLAAMDKWVKTKCPKCGGPARRETDTMPNWAGSSWYFLRYCDPENKKEFASMDKLKYWMGAPTPVLPPLLTSPRVPVGDPFGTGEEIVADRGGKSGGAQKYFIFDFDGVIGDTFEAVLAAKIKMGYDPDLEAARKTTMEYAMKKPDHARNNGILTQEELERMNDWTKRFGAAMAQERFGLFDEFIKEVEQIPNARIAIVSSGSEVYVRPAMERTTLKTTHVLNFEDHHSKVEKIQRVCKDWGVGMKDVYYFTDTKADIFELEEFVDREKIIGCAWGYLGKEELESILPREQILENYADIHRLYNRTGGSVGGVDPACGGVNWYNGGMEHTVLHLLYSRFWNQFLYDIGVVPCREPYKKRTSHGMILAEDGEKMSKSRGNVINPNEIVEKYGADVLRVYEMFMGPFDQAVPWSTKSIAGVERFLEKIWREYEMEGAIIKLEPSVEANKERYLHKTIKKVTEDIEAMKFNTAIATMMGFVGTSGLRREKKEDQKRVREIFLRILAPFAPHIVEELWELLHNAPQPPLTLRGGDDGGLLCQQPWPKYDPALIKDEEIELVIQINGKVRDRLCVSAEISEQDAKAVAMGSEKVQKWLDGQKIKDVVFIRGKLLNIVL